MKGEGFLHDSFFKKNGYHDGNRCLIVLHLSVGQILPQFGIRIVHKKVGSLTNILYLYR